MVPTSAMHPITSGLYSGLSRWPLKNRRIIPPECPIPPTRIEMREGDDINVADDINLLILKTLSMRQTNLSECVTIVESWFDWFMLTRRGNFQIHKDNNVHNVHSLENKKELGKRILLMHIQYKGAYLLQN